MAEVIELVLKILACVNAVIVMIAAVLWIACKHTLTREEAEAELSGYVIERLKERGLTPEQMERLSKAMREQGCEVTDDKRP